VRQRARRAAALLPWMHTFKPTHVARGVRDQAHARCAKRGQLARALLRGSTRAAMRARVRPGTCACRYVAPSARFSPIATGLPPSGTPSASASLVQSPPWRLDDDAVLKKKLLGVHTFVELTSQGGHQNARYIAPNDVSSVGCTAPASGSLVPR
jgi:hypothetical protein